MNRYGLPEDGLAALRERDTLCVYCHRALLYPWDGARRAQSATIEHLNHLPPWDDISTVAYCCGSCNSSRRNLTHSEWFKTAYCIDRGITAETVAQPVRAYLARLAE